MIEENLKQIAEQEYQRLMKGKNFRGDHGDNFMAAAFIARKFLSNEQSRKAAEESIKAYLKVFKGPEVGDRIRGELWERIYSTSQIFGIENSELKRLEKDWMTYQQRYYTIPKEFYEKSWMPQPVKRLIDSRL